MKRYYLRSSYAKKLFRNIISEFSELKKYVGKNVEVIEFNENFSYLIIDGRPDFIMYKGIVFPSIELLKKINLEKYWILVDKGAAKSILNGADLMRPGVMDYDRNIKKDYLVYIKYGNFPIAIGYNLWDVEEYEKNKKGKCVKVFHRVNDKYHSFILKNLGS